MAWNDVPWANGDYITEQKLDYMVGNDEHLRAELDGRLLACQGYGTMSKRSCPSGARTLKLYVDSTLLWTSASITGAWVAWTGCTNLSISSIAAGLRSLDLVTFAGTGEIIRWPFRFQKTADLLYISIFGLAALYGIWEYEPGDPGTWYFNEGLAVRGFTALGHRTVKSW